MPASNKLRELVEKGIITEDMMMQSLAPRIEEDLEIRTVKAPSKLKIAGKYLFNHGIEQTHFNHRLDAKEAVSQPIGLVAYGVIGAIDAVVDSAFYLIGELTEDVTFGVSRIVYRAESGWNRGKTGTTHE